jgi:hypothetical protein
MWPEARTKKGRPKLYLLDTDLGELSPAEIRERVSTAAASHLLWNIMFDTERESGIPKVRYSITEKQAWDIALRTQYWPYLKFEDYIRELVDAGFLRRMWTRRKKDTGSPQAPFVETTNF